jgi:hypothetical protein
LWLLLLLPLLLLPLLPLLLLLLLLLLMLQLLLKGCVLFLEQREALSCFSQSFGGVIKIDFQA